MHYESKKIGKARKNRIYLAIMQSRAIHARVALQSRFGILKTQPTFIDRLQVFTLLVRLL